MIFVYFILISPDKHFLSHFISTTFITHEKSSVYSGRLLNANIKGQIAFFLGKNKWHAIHKSFELWVVKDLEKIQANWLWEKSWSFERFLKLFRKGFFEKVHPSTWNFTVNNKSFRVNALNCHKI